MGRRVQRVALTNNSGWRAFSGTGSGDDGDQGESRMGDIYTDLFGDDNDDVTDMGGDSVSYSRGGGDSEQARRRPRQERKQTAPAESKPSLQESDMPQPLWSDTLEITEERWQSKIEFEDIPDWSPDFVSRVSKERVQLLPGKNA